MPLGPSIKLSCFPNMVLEPRFRSPDAQLALNWIFFSNLCPDPIFASAAAAPLSGRRAYRFSACCMALRASSCAAGSPGLSCVCSTLSSAAGLRCSIVSKAHIEARLLPRIEGTHRRRCSQIDTDDKLSGGRPSRCGHTSAPGPGLRVNAPSVPAVDPIDATLRILLPATGALSTLLDLRYLVLVASGSNLVLATYFLLLRGAACCFPAAT